jgi:hypothetical protein
MQGLLSTEILMSATLEELKATVSGSPVFERTKLAHYLLRTLKTFA